MSYTIKVSDKAIDDSEKLEKDEPKAYKKFLTFLDELKEHPRTGTGHPEQLSGDRAGQ